MRNFPLKGLLGVAGIFGLSLLLFFVGYSQPSVGALDTELDKITVKVFSSETQEEILSILEILDILGVRYKNFSQNNRIDYLKGVLHYKIENFENAILSWSACYSNRRYHLSPLSLLYTGMVLESLGRLKEAVDSFRLHQKRYPNHFTQYEATLGLSRCLFSLSSKQESVNILQLHKFDEKNPYSIFFRRQLSFFSQGL